LLILREEHRLRGFENRVLRTFGTKRDKVTREWRKLYEEEHVAYIGVSGEVYTGFWWGNLSERDHLGDPDVDGRII
jgi:hypothetical protein